MKAKALLALFLIFSLSSAGEKTHAAACPKPLTSSSPFIKLPCVSGDPRWEKAYAHWDKRGDLKEAKAATKLFEELAKDYPDNLEAQVWLCRGYYMVGALVNNPDEKAAWMKKASEVGDKILARDPENIYAFYWKYSAMVFYHDFTAEDFRKIQEFGKNYENIRELPVPDDDPLWAEAIKHWDNRYDRKESEKAIAIFTKLEQKYPDRIEPKLWLLRSTYWMHYIAKTEKEKADWCMTAAEWGRKALEMEPRNPAANYLTASALGQYGTHTSFLNMVRYSLEITQRLMTVTQEDPNYYYGGVSQYFALAIARAGSIVSKTLPLIGFSQDLVMKFAEFAYNYEPRYLRNYYAMGELYLKLGEKEKAKQMLLKTINSDPTALKNMEPENRVAQELARKLLEEHFKD